MFLEKSVSINKIYWALLKHIVFNKYLIKLQLTNITSMIFNELYIWSGWPSPESLKTIEDIISVVVLNQTNYTNIIV